MKILTTTKRWHRLSRFMVCCDDCSGLALSGPGSLRIMIVRAFVKAFKWIQIAQLL